MLLSGVDVILTIFYLHLSVNPVDDCPAPTEIPNGFVNVYYNPNGSVSEYGCLEPYYLKGNRIVQCNLAKGMWPVDIPECCK